MYIVYVVVCWAGCAWQVFSKLLYENVLDSLALRSIRAAREGRQVDRGRGRLKTLPRPRRQGFLGVSFRMLRQLALSLGASALNLAMRCTERPFSGG